MTAATWPAAWRRAPVSRVCAVVARAVLAAEGTGGEAGASADEGPGGARLGDVTLRPHQRDAVARLRRAMREWGGALLADEVGLGKTFVALALAREARSPLVVAPASLRATWSRAFGRTGVRAPFVSTERLSRRDPPAPPGAPHDLVIVDEAHHFRNPRTRRYAALASVARQARVLLLSATPVHNRRAELDALLALFLGSHASTLDEADHARLVVRRGHDALSAATRPPRALPLRVVHVPVRDGVTERILALPPPVATSDGGVAGALVAHGLMRLWASSAGALRAGLRRRLVRAEALLAALDTGHHLSRAELGRWAVGDDAVQLAFPELLGACDPEGTRAAGAGAMRASLRRHLEGVRAALAALGAEDDSARADALRRVRRRHAGERIVAFTQLAETARAYFAALRTDGGVCALTSREAIVAGGRLSRAEALRRFAPVAHGAPEPGGAERVTLLLSTDVAAEGIDLTDASVVVHLDMPWTPARLEQRVGRLTRLGSPHAEVAVYALAPPALLRALAGIDRALRAKRDAARRIVGGSGVELVPTDDEPSPAPPGGGSGADARDSVALAPIARRTSVPEASERLREVLAGWLHDAPASRPHPARAPRPAVGGPTLVGAVEARGVMAPAFVALVSHGGDGRLVAGTLAGRAPSDDPRDVLRVARAVGSAGAAGAAHDVPVDPDVVRGALAAVSGWIADRHARRALGPAGASTLRLQRRILARVAAVVRDAPLHRRSRIAAAAAGARRTLARPLPAGAERELALLAGAALPPEAWLEAVASLHDLREPRAGSAWASGAGAATIGALLLVVPPRRVAR